MFHRAVRRVPGIGPSNDRLSVLQFNVLNPHLAPKPVDASDDAARAVDFAHRFELNLAHIQAMSADVVVLEEVHDNAHYGPQLAAMGYDYLFEQKDGGTGDGTLVAYRRSSIAVGRARPRVVRFGTAETPGSQFAFLVHLVKRDTDTTQDSEPVERDFILIAQHAKAGRSEANEAIRVAHARRLVLQELPSFQDEAFDTDERRSRFRNRVVWAGDFNAGPHTYGGKYPCVLLPWLTTDTARGSDGGLIFESCMANATKQCASSTTLDAAAAPEVGARARSTSESDGDDLLFTTCKLRDGSLIAQTIDFVLVPRGDARCVGWLPCPAADPADLAPLYLPSTQWGSDHLSVYAEIDWIRTPHPRRG